MWRVLFITGKSTFDSGLPTLSHADERIRTRVINSKLARLISKETILMTFEIQSERCLRIGLSHLGRSGSWLPTHCDFAL